MMDWGGLAEPAHDFVIFGTSAPCAEVFLLQRRRMVFHAE
jgi:hypothetical protein